MSTQEYREAHKEEIRLNNRKYRAEHAEQIKAQKHENYMAHREQIAKSHLAWCSKNREHARAKNTEYQHANGPKLRANDKKYRAANYGKILTRKYGIGLEEYQRLIASQNGKCPICGRLLPAGNPVVDHDHDTGRVRGVLHNRCNLAIGIFGDSPRRLRIAAAYLEKHAQGVLL